MASLLFLLAWLFVFLLSFIPVSGVTLIPGYSLVVFVLLSFLTYFIAESVFKRRVKVSKSGVSRRGFYCLSVVFLIFCSVNFYFSGFRVPIGEYLGIGYVRYNEFGVSGLQGFNNSLYLVMMMGFFYLSFYKKDKLSLFLFIIFLLYPVLIVSRQVLFSLVLQLFFVWYVLYGAKGFRFYLYALLVGVFSIYLFGYLGDLRVASDGNDGYALMVDLLSATEFGQTLNSSFLWLYAYLVSPISNLQLNIDMATPSGNIVPYIQNILPTPVRVAVFGDLGFEGADNVYLVNQNLNVGTAYLMPYLSYGWLGMAFHSFMMFLFIVFISLLKGRGLYGVFLYAVLIQIFVFSIFTNLLFYLPVVFQVFIISIMILIDNKNSFLKFKN